MTKGDTPSLAAVASTPLKKSSAPPMTSARPATSIATAAKADISDVASAARSASAEGHEARS